MTVRVTVTGVARLRRGLARAERNLSDLAPPTRRAADDVARTARRLAAKRTGRMASGVRRTVNGGTAVISNQVRYAPYQEYGTRVMNAHPFMRPAVQATPITKHYEDHAARAVRHL